MVVLIVGIEPYETILDRSNEHDRLVLDIEAIGESAATIVGESTYRELPEQWVIEQIDSRPNYEVVATRQFPMKLTSKSLSKQLDYAGRMAEKIVDRDLREAFEKRVEDLNLALETFATHTRAHNYAIVVKRRV